ncbi:MAG: cbb3-type cytochrome c oxidase subunit 3 [Rhodobacteraceae bacterium]|uniref:cbb3-type cytochrome c oxidase subunit 3 n=1 Tax=Amaricoccus sp. B4 TaxID=3368557 RepID=UPI000DABAF75|nr:cbb3-type cytochrome c oxidase subunit 3 [Paracoccaceae bacterium]
MDTYTALRHFADSWAVLGLLIFFGGVVLWVFRPGSREIYKDSANMIFRNESKPKDD